LRKKYRTVSLSKEVVEKIEDYIKKHPESGYASVAEFTREAVRNALKEARKEAGSK